MKYDCNKYINIDVRIVDVHIIAVKNSYPSQMITASPPPLTLLYLIKQKALLDTQREGRTQEPGSLAVSKETHTQVHILLAQKIHTWRSHLKNSDR